MSLALALLSAGATRRALREADRATRIDGAPDRGALELQRAIILERLGRLGEALDGYRLAIAGFRRGGDRNGEARALCDRGVLQTYRGELGAAEADLRRAETLCDELGLGLMGASVRQNLGFVAAQRGDVPRGLACYEQAQATFAAIGGTRYALLELDRCSLLLAAGLTAEARASADRAIAALVETAMGAEVAEARLQRAEVALAERDWPAAQEAAGAALRAFTAQRRPTWAALARDAAVRAAWGAYDDGADGARLLAAARRAAADLERSGWTARAVHAHLLAGRVALALGRPRAALRDLEVARRARFHGPAALRIAGWHAEALMSVAGSDPDAGAARRRRRAARARRRPGRARRDRAARARSGAGRGARRPRAALRARARTARHGAGARRAGTCADAPPRAGHAAARPGARRAARRAARGRRARRGGGPGRAAGGAARRAADPARARDPAAAPPGPRDRGAGVRAGADAARAARGARGACADRVPARRRRAARADRDGAPGAGRRPRPWPRRSSASWSCSASRCAGWRQEADPARTARTRRTRPPSSSGPCWRRCSPRSATASSCSCRAARCTRCRGRRCPRAPAGRCRSRRPPRCGSAPPARRARATRPAVARRRARARGGRRRGRGDRRALRRRDGPHRADAGVDAVSAALGGCDRAPPRLPRQLPRRQPAVLGPAARRRPADRARRRALAPARASWCCPPATRVAASSARATS